jgi:thioredoxin 1
MKKGNFKNLIDSEIPVLVDFFADWCQPCKIQAPILEQVAKDMSGKVKIVKINVDKNRGLAQQYQIQGVPTLAIFKNRKMVWRKSGVMQKQQLKQIIEEHNY